MYWFKYVKVFVSLLNMYEAMKEVYPPARIVKFTIGVGKKKNEN